MTKHIIVPMLFVIRNRTFEKVWEVENFMNFLLYEFF